MQILPEECVELLLMMQQQKASWLNGDENPNLWMRIDDAGECSYALLLAEAEGQIDVSAIAVGLSQEEADAALERLLCGWTGYGRRVGPSTPWPVQPWSKKSDGRVGMYLLQGGGWVELKLVNDVLTATLSLPNGGTGSMAFSGLIAGVVRPFDGRHPRDVAAVLGAWEE